MSEKIEKILERLRERNLTLAFAESMSSGRVINEFSKCRGAGDVLLGGIVTYRPELKIQLLHVNKRTIDRHTAESRQVTSEMAYGIYKLLQPDIAAAVTGLASPGGSETKEKPVGTVFISIIYNDILYEYKEFFEPDNSKEEKDSIEEIMLKTVDSVTKKICALQL